MFSKYMQTLVYTGLRLSEILILQKYKWRNHFKLYNINSVSMCNTSSDREKNQGFIRYIIILKYPVYSLGDVGR